MVRVRPCRLIGIRSARWQQPNVPVQPREPLVVVGVRLILSTPTARTQTMTASSSTPVASLG